MLVGIYDVVVSFDHRLKKSWIVSTGYPHYDQKTRMKNAEYRLQQVYAEIVAAQSQTTLAPVVGKKMRSNFSKQAYEQAVSHARQYILAGDIFEVNLSQQFHAKLDSPEEAMGLYLQLRQTNPAPFSAYLKFDEFVLASASPERFLKVKNRQVESRPIKGTIAVSKDWAENEKNKNALLNSEKDRAENTMIVDLMRNDFSRVCEPNSVVVEKLCGLETYEAVHHLVSVIRGTLQDNKDAIDLLAVSFPGGSITGAPKIRAMQIISELERRPRGPHYGSVGYISFSGDMDTSILIRSFAIEGTDVTLQAGGAITLDSDPSLEYEESLLKAASCQKALECSL
jgi:para-aminobenzoate synthetase component 1